MAGHGRPRRGGDSCRCHTWVEVDFNHSGEGGLAILAVSPRHVEMAQRRARVVLVARVHPLAEAESRIEGRARRGALGLLEHLAGLREAPGATKELQELGDGRVVGWLLREHLLRVEDGERDERGGVALMD